MQNRLPTPRDQRPPIPDFAPVPRKYRHDGWTPDRQRAFIEALADTGSVKAAAKRINMSPEGAYYLRRQPGAEGFAHAWEVALDHGVQNLRDIALERAIEGVPVPVFWQGEQCGERRRYNDRLLMFILRHHVEGGGLFGGTASRSLAEAGAEAWFAERGRALGTLLAAHRLALRQAVHALFAGDHWDAADREHAAREIERTIDGDPADWPAAAGLLAATAQAEAELAEDELPDPVADPDHCRPLAEAPDHGIPAETAPSLLTQPWDEHTATLIPRLPLHPAIRRGGAAVLGGPTWQAREQARHAAETRIREAQAEWLATGSEADWARWGDDRSFCTIAGRTDLPI